MEFKNTVINSPMITFKQAKEVEKEYNPGEPLPATNTCSLGYRARVTSNTSIVGIMTAVHCSQTGGGVGNAILDSSGNLFGTVWSWQESGPIDAAFIATGNSIPITNTLNMNSSNTGLGSTLSTTVVKSFTIGQWVGKVGKKTGYSVGTVTSTNYTFPGQSNQIGASYDSESGYSGAIVFSGSTSNYTTAGIHMGTSSGTKVFSSAYVINSKFGISKY